MSLQTVSGKILSKTNFLESTPYERYDLTDSIKYNDKFVIRQGDLIISNYEVDVYKRIGLRVARLSEKDGIYVFRNSHFVIPTDNKTVLIHNEHGITIIPKPMEKLNFYTFMTAGD